MLFLKIPIDIGYTEYLGHLSRFAYFSIRYYYIIVFNLKAIINYWVLKTIQKVFSGTKHMVVKTNTRFLTITLLTESTI